MKRTLLALVLTVPLGDLRAGLIIIDPGPGGDGASLLQAAIDGAQDGDVILLKAGD